LLVLVTVSIDLFKTNYQSNSGMCFHTILFLSADATPYQFGIELETTKIPIKYQVALSSTMILLPLSAAIHHYLYCIFNI
jgi:hypothetical protein